MSDANLGLSTDKIIRLIEESDCIKIIGCNPLVKTLTSPEFIVALRKRIEELFKSTPKQENKPVFHIIHGKRTGRLLSATYR